MENGIISYIRELFHCLFPHSASLTFYWAFGNLEKYLKQLSQIWEFFCVIWRKTLLIRVLYMVFITLSQEFDFRPFSLLDLNLRISKQKGKISGKICSTSYDISDPSNYQKQKKDPIFGKFELPQSCYWGHSSYLSHFRPFSGKWRDDHISLFSFFST